MRSFLLFLAFLASAQALTIVNKVGYNDTDSSGGYTPGDAYNSSYTQGRIYFTLVPAAPLTPGASVWITKGSTAGYWLQTTVKADGTLNASTFTATTNSPHDGTASGVVRKIEAGVQNTWGSLPYVEYASYFRQEVIGNQGGAPKYEDYYQTIIIYPANFQFGNFNVQLSSRTRTDAPVDYMLVWDGDAKGQSARMPAGNPRQSFSQLFSKLENVTETPASPKAFTLYRRTVSGVAGSWLVVASGTCPVGGIINVFDDPQAGTGTAPTTELPDEADVVTNTGGGTGTGIETAGSGVSTPSTGGGEGGSGGSGGTGTEIDYDAVQAAVRGGVNQAAGDTTTPGTPTPATLTGMEGADNAEADGNAIKSGVTGVVSSASGFLGDGYGANFVSLNLPSVSTGDYAFPFTLPMFGARTIDLSAYASYISVLRALQVAAMILTFWFFNVKIVKATVS